jgi:hypothetical protein
MNQFWNIAVHVAEKPFNLKKIRQRYVSQICKLSIQPLIGFKLTAEKSPLKCLPGEKKILRTKTFPKVIIEKEY